MYFRRKNSRYTTSRLCLSESYKEISRFRKKFALFSFCTISSENSRARILCILIAQRQAELVRSRRVSPGSDASFSPHMVGRSMKGEAGCGKNWPGSGVTSRHFFQPILLSLRNESMSKQRQCPALEQKLISYQTAYR